jgi:predicted ferric reductase
MHHGWLPGQHIFLTIPSMGFKYRFQAHPFTIASPAPSKNNTITSWPLQLVIRSIDGFSLDLLNYARHHQHCEVVFDGPHGGVEASEAARHAERTCFVAGGSGIAVTYPLAWEHQVEEYKQREALLDTRTV